VGKTQDDLDERSDASTRMKDQKAMDIKLATFLKQAKRMLEEEAPVSQGANPFIRKFRTEVPEDPESFSAASLLD